MGDSDFAADVLAEADEAMERKTALAAQGIDLQRAIDLVADLMSMPRERIVGSCPSRNPGFQIPERMNPDSFFAYRNPHGLLPGKFDGRYA